MTGWHMAVSAPLGTYLVLCSGPTSQVGEEMTETMYRILASLTFYVQ